MTTAKTINLRVILLFLCELTFFESLAKSGDPEAAELHRISRRSLWIALPTAVILTLRETMTKK
jgi:hypothetical protein